MGQGIREERGGEFALGEFGDVRLKKLERNCMSAWLANKAYACVSLAEAVQEKFVSGDF